MKKIAKKVAKKVSALPYVIVRCTGAGVHAGHLVSRKGAEVRLKDSRRIWYWKGANSLSELAVYGAKYPTECKFAVVVPTIDLFDACEIIHCQPDGIAMIKGCAPWRA